MANTTDSKQKYFTEVQKQLMQELGITNINIKSFHLEQELSADDVKAGRKEFENAGLHIVGPPHQDGLVLKAAAAYEALVEGFALPALD